MLGRLNPFRRVRVAGIDLGTHSLKWVLFETSLREVVQSGAATLWPERDGPGPARDFHALENRVRRCLDEIPRDVHVFNAAVQGRGTAYGYLEFPRLEEEELKVAAQAEAQRWIAFPPQTVQFSYTKVPPREPNGDLLGVFYAAAQHTQVDRLRALLMRCGRSPQRVEIPALALAREFEMNHGNASPGCFYALVQVGFELTQFVIVRAGFPYYARDFRPAAADFCVALQRQERCEWAQAEVGLAEADFGWPCLAAARCRLVLALRRSLAAFPGQVGGIYLSGGGLVGNLAEVLAEELQMPVEVDSWMQIKGTSQPPGLFKLAAGLCVA